MLPFQETFTLLLLEVSFIDGTALIIEPVILLDTL